MWDLLSLDLSRIAKKAASIFRGIRDKGDQRGDVMDSTTEAILIPQIVEEAFARDVVETVRNLGKRVSGINAKISLSLALPSDDEATWDQIEMDVSYALGSKENALGVQPEFLGSEWASLVLEDVVRFARDEKMSETSNTFALMTVAPADPDEDRRPSPTASARHDPTQGGPASAPYPRMAWIEGDDVSYSYPALGELIQQLHALPFEINGTVLCHILPTTDFSHI